MKSGWLRTRVKNRYSYVGYEIFSESDFARDSIHPLHQTTDLGVCLLRVLIHLSLALTRAAWLATCGIVVIWIFWDDEARSF